MQCSVGFALSSAVNYVFMPAVIGVAVIPGEVQQIYKCGFSLANTSTYLCKAALDIQ